MRAIGKKWVSPLLLVAVAALFSSNLFGQALVREVAPLHTPTQGLQGKHLAVWQSHGYYFESKLNRWEWQRARIFQTVEDLYTQAYVLPFLVPMLENSGAVVLLPRERDTSINEYIIDNDPTPYTHGTYSESGRAWREVPHGFAYSKKLFRDFDNPFKEGTSRHIRTKKVADSSAFWQVEVKEDAYHAVYVSYQATQNNAPDALYTVHHAGGEQRFFVNQRMGGGTWIYLGTFPFSNNGSRQGVELSNQSEIDGAWVSADAVKIGGGMGNIERAYQDSIPATSPLSIEVQAYQSSGYPRFCEGARYWLQWAGVPDSIFTRSRGLNDYTDDYQSRGYWVNYLAGGSARNPQQEGLGIPIDLVLALHSDAGTLLGDSIVGTLGIYNSKWNDGVYPDGRSRLLAKAYTDSVMTQIVHDIRACHAPEWVRREMWDRAYSEATHPVVPSLLLELLSHQNFPDMRYGLDPEFRFTVSRAIYKGMLRYLKGQGELQSYTVQPLPVKDFVAHFTDTDRVQLSWQATEDLLEPTAKPNSYLLYTSIDGAPFDGGRILQTNHTEVTIEPERLYRFKVEAVNEGGKSFPSEILSVGIPAQPKGKVMVVNGFTRISAPDWIDYPESHISGFVPEIDGGVPYLYDISYIGAQKVYDRTLPWIDDDNSGFGDSRSDYETKVIAGNSFDYPSVHGKAILAAGYAFASSSSSYISEHPELLLQYDGVDLILGKQKQTIKGPNDGRVAQYKALPRSLRDAIEVMANHNKGILISGAYVGSDLWHDRDSVEQASGRAFAQEVLHYFLRADRAAIGGEVETVQNQVGLSPQSVKYTHKLSPTHYVIESPDAIEPTSGAATVMRYSENNLSAAVAYNAGYRSVVLGFPMEAIEDEGELHKLMRELLGFIIE